MSTCADCRHASRASDHSGAPLDNLYECHRYAPCPTTHAAGVSACEHVVHWPRVAGGTPECGDFKANPNP